MIEENKIYFDGEYAFSIWSDLGDALHACLDNWSARTNEYTAQSLVDYVNSKGVHQAFLTNTKL